MFRPFKAAARIYRILIILIILIIPLSMAISQEQEQEYEAIDSSACVDCHEKGKHDTAILDDLSHSIHEGLECQDCHMDKKTLPHKVDTAFNVKCGGCKECHADVGEVYQIHGRDSIEDCLGAPTCADCHGDHEILPSSVKLSKTHPSNLPKTCGVCHENLDLTKK